LLLKRELRRNFENVRKPQEEKKEKKLQKRVRKPPRLFVPTTPNATAFAMGISYQSKCHPDKDYYYSLLLVTALTKQYDTERNNNNNNTTRR